MEHLITYEDVFQHTSNGVVVTGNDGLIELINDTAIDILKLHGRSPVGQTVSTILPHIDIPINRCLENGEPILGHQITVNNAQLILNITPIAKKNKLIGAVCTLQELSVFETSAQNTKSYQALNRQLEMIFQSSSDGIWVCDGTGTIISVNRASELLNGIKAEKIVGSNVRELLNEKIFDQSVTTKVMASRKRETVMQYVAKTDKYLLSTGTPSLDEQGNIALIVINERDMTELNALRRNYEQSQKVKEKYEEELSELSLRELDRNMIIADSHKMRNLHQMALKLSNIGASNILILGESGTGKGLLAKFIHKSSNRRSKPFVEINCAALPENLLEAELFGYEQGAFTGASDKGKIGLIELAQGGTLFLDEIGDMPIMLQSKLLKFLDNREIRRIGGTESVTIECVTIAATNKTLKRQVAEKLFREDLYYRLSSFVLQLPPLTDRREDIPGLARFYLREFNQKYNSRKTITPLAIRYLLNHPFPGNIRELKSIIENAVVMSETNQLDDFIRQSTSIDQGHDLRGEPVDEETEFSLASQLATLEKQILQNARDRFGTTREIATRIGISQPSVVRKLRRHGIK